MIMTNTFGGEELCQNSSESIHKKFRRDNKVLPFGKLINHVTLNLQCGFRA